MPEKEKKIIINPGQAPYRTSTQTVLEQRPSLDTLGQQTLEDLTGYQTTPTVLLAREENN